jgi:hypothetical protein
VRGFVRPYLSAGMAVVEADILDVAPRNAPSPDACAVRLATAAATTDVRGDRNVATDPGRSPPTELEPRWRSRPDHWTGDRDGDYPAAVLIRAVDAVSTVTGATAVIPGQAPALTQTAAGNPASLPAPGGFRGRVTR